MKQSNGIIISRLIIDHKLTFDDLEYLAYDILQFVEINQAIKIQKKVKK